MKKKIFFVLFLVLVLILTAGKMTAMISSIDITQENSISETQKIAEQHFKKARGFENVQFRSLHLTIAQNHFERAFSFYAREIVDLYGFTGHGYRSPPERQAHLH